MSDESRCAPGLTAKTQKGNAAKSVRNGLRPTLFQRSLWFLTG
ncbi:MAG: hypothetical protein Q4F99_05185 [bacterium]|nr:hypothetical protein [bacterium]